MYRFLLICLGGAVGTGARYLVAVGVPRFFGTSFPYATLAVNCLGSFLIGVLMHVGLSTNLMTPGLRLAVTTGALGGFTTYSTFNYETVELLREGAVWLAGLNVAVTVLLCLAAGAAGLGVGRWLVGS
jgi:CrcB protein